MLAVNHRIEIPLKEFTFTFARGSGPGGQNVNKVNSKATLRWQVQNSPALPEDVRQRFMDKYHNRLTADGELVISSDQFRDQGRNVTECLDRVREMLLDVAVPPKKRRATKPSRSKVEQRLQSKKSHGAKKQSRGRVRDY